MGRSNKRLAGLRRNPPYRTMKSKAGIPVILYDTAMNQLAYGATPQMGDLFNDIMGTVVPGWDARPDWMKKIVVKPDPAKIMQAAANVIKPAQAGAIVDQASKAGVNLYYNTPAGQVPVTGSMVSGGMSYGPGFYSASSAISSIPSWVYLAAGGGLLLLLFMRK